MVVTWKNTKYVLEVQMTMFKMLYMNVNNQQSHQSTHSLTLLFGLYLYSVNSRLLDSNSGPKFNIHWEISTLWRNTPLQKSSKMAAEWGNCVGHTGHANFGWIKCQLHCPPNRHPDYSSLSVPHTRFQNSGVVQANWRMSTNLTEQKLTSTRLASSN
jgi:hypothetical protein